MSAAPLVELRGISKHYGGAEPLRVVDLHVAASDRLSISGLDAGAAETFMHLVTGAALPDEGDVRIDGRPTRDIATDTEWLHSLDRFGIVTERSVLFESLPAAASLALPLSLSLDPMPPDVRREVEAMAKAVGLEAPRLDVPASSLTALERLRVHLARAIAHRPAFVLLERPTDRLGSVSDRRAFAATLRQASEARPFGWLAITDDEAFARAAGGDRLALSRGSGVVSSRSRWARWPWTRGR